MSKSLGSVKKAIAKHHIPHRSLLYRDEHRQVLQGLNCPKGPFFDCGCLSQKKQVDASLNGLEGYKKGHRENIEETPLAASLAEGSKRSCAQPAGLASV